MQVVGMAVCTAIALPYLSFAWTHSLTDTVPAVPVPWLNVNQRVLYPPGAAALKLRPPFAVLDAVWIVEIDARNEAKLIGVVMIERTVDDAYFFAPLCIATEPVMLPSA